jgi:long-chain acyl-CoA synthetase
MDVSAFSELVIAPRAVFDRLAERRSRARFMVPDGDDWRAVTWGAFARQIRQCASFLSASGLKPGERAAVFAANRVEWMSAALAIQAAGGVLVPIYASSTAAQASYVMQHSDARVLFVDGAGLLARVLEAWNEIGPSLVRVVLLDDALDPSRALAELRDAGKPVPTLSDVEGKLVRWSRALAIGASRDAEDPQAFERTMAAVSLDAPGLMLYTSGTSGNPKGVPLTHANVGINALDWMRNNAPLLEEYSVDLFWLPMSHIFGFGEACLGNTLGFTSYLVEPHTVMTRLPEVRPDVFMSVPSYWEKIANAAAAEPGRGTMRERLAAVTGGRLRFCLSGGAGLHRSVKELFHECGILLLEGYGLTETSPTLTINRPDGFRFDSVGKPLPSVELKLAEDGEILARGPSVFSGYHKDAAATREAFTDDGWFKTGDIGRFTDDGFLQIVDRKKDILVTAGGKNVPPANIEVRFRDDPFLSHVVVYGDAKRYLVAGVWLNEPAVMAHLAEKTGSQLGPEARAEAVRALVQSRIDRVNADLATFETIKRFTIIRQPLSVESGHLTPTLKVRRKHVYKSFREAFESLYA